MFTQLRWSIITCQLDGNIDEGLQIRPFVDLFRDFLVFLVNYLEDFQMRRKKFLRFELSV